jgi:hypothetical protein
MFYTPARDSPAVYVDKTKYAEDQKVMDHGMRGGKARG